jgi:hypothetical protein
LEPSALGSRATWTDGGELGFDPIPRLFAGLFEAKLAQDFQEALGKLEATAR